LKLKQMIQYMKSLLDTKSTNSSKRFIGLVGAFSLIIAMFIFHTTELYYCFAAMSSSALALTGLEKIFEK